MYGAFIGSRVQRSNGMLEVKVLGRNIWRLFYDSLRQSFWQCNVQLLHENGNLEIELNHPKDIGLVGPKTLDPITWV